MAKFHDVIGFIQDQIEAVPGVWKDNIVEREYYGDILRNSVRSVSGENLNNDLTVGNSISIMADDYASVNFFTICYIKWAGTLWTVDNVEVKSPRLILRLGGVYNGPKATVTPDP